MVLARFQSRLLLFFMSLPEVFQRVQPSVNQATAEA
jgi:hypothetical protein